MPPKKKKERRRQEVLMPAPAFIPTLQPVVLQFNFNNFNNLNLMPMPQPGNQQTLVGELSEGVLVEQEEVAGGPDLSWWEEAGDEVDQWYYEIDWAKLEELEVKEGVKEVKEEITYEHRHESLSAKRPGGLKQEQEESSSKDESAPSEGPSRMPGGFFE